MLWLRTLDSLSNSFGHDDLNDFIYSQDNPSYQSPKRTAQNVLRIYFVNRVKQDLSLRELSVRSVSSSALASLRSD